MRCPKCGYPNKEEAPVCPSCNSWIAGSANSEHIPISTTEAPKRLSFRDWLERIVRERWSTWLVPIVLLLMTLILPWVNSYYFNLEYLTKDYIIRSNLIDLLMADNPLIASMAIIYLVGCVITLLFPVLVVAPICSLVVLMYSLPDYMISLLPSTPPNATDEFDTGYGIGFGLLLAWLTVASLGVLCLRNSELRFVRGGGKDMSPSENDDPGALDFRRGGLGPGPP
jgi:hypothetical protein